MFQRGKNKVFYKGENDNSERTCVKIVKNMEVKWCSLYEMNIIAEVGG